MSRPLSRYGHTTAWIGIKASPNRVADTSDTKTFRLPKPWLDSEPFVDETDCDEELPEAVAEELARVSRVVELWLPASSEVTDLLLVETEPCEPDAVAVGLDEPVAAFVDDSYT
ncbi:hypothetical protein OGATHE_001002 [Ogataea polymorpha]|uniref:Uncharacterized protein n=1 Tax=Ogataea polymorpha TaxID=460523 RepID=A0A9P8PSV4_9ASCO|nr:hypothetical protein OGATHE_001002 [Ogataea polymorpha]